MALFVTGGQHFWHETIRVIEKRPWPDRYAMNEGLAARWNERVGEADDVWILGDFSFGGEKRTKELLAALHGNKFLVPGNHDGSRAKNMSLGFADVVEDECRLLIPGGPAVYVRHRPEYVSSKWQGCKVHLCGHVHGLWKLMMVSGGIIVNIDVEVWDYAPVPIASILALPQVRAELFPAQLPIVTTLSVGAVVGEKPCGCPVESTCFHKQGKKPRRVAFGPKRSLARSYSKARIIVACREVGVSGEQETALLKALR